MENQIIIKHYEIFQFVDGREDINDCPTMHQLGSHLVHMFHVLHQLDCLAQLSGNKKPEQIDYTQSVVHFNTLLSLMISHSGKQAVIAVLGLGKNLEMILPFLKLKGKDDPETTPCKMACFGYAIELLSVVIKFQDNVEMLEKYADKIYEIIEAEETREGQKSEETAKLMELIPWISVARTLENFNYDHLTQLCNNIKDHIDKIEKFPGELITSMRILLYLTVPKYPISDLTPDQHNNELIEELKYKYATVQLFYGDLHTYLINLLTKLANMYQQPFLHSTNFIGCEGALVIALIKPALGLLKNLLSCVIQARNTTFKDLTAVVPLLQCYLLLQAFPVSSPYTTITCRLQKEIISLLLVYTQPVYSTTEGEQVLSKSLWTKMMSEVIFLFILILYHVIVL